MNIPEFKINDVVHFHAYNWYEPQERIVSKITKEEDRIFYHLKTLDGKTPVNITTGSSIVESDLYLKPQKGS